MYSKEDSTSVANIWHPGLGAKLSMCVKYTNLYPWKSFLSPSPGATWVLLLAFPWCRLSSLSQVAEITAHTRRPSHPVTPLFSCCLPIIPFLLPSKSSSVPFWQHWPSFSSFIGNRPAVMTSLYYLYAVILRAVIFTLVFIYTPVQRLTGTSNTTVTIITNSMCPKQKPRWLLSLFQRPGQVQPPRLKSLKPFICPFKRDLRVCLISYILHNRP